MPNINCAYVLHFVTFRRWLLHFFDNLLPYVISIACLLDDIAQVPLELDPVLGLQLQVILLRLLEGFAHLQIKLGVVHELSRSEQALLV